jgi:Na+-driven multidrug efflux pump
VSFYVLGPCYLFACLSLSLGFTGVWVAFALAIISTGIMHYVFYLRWSRHWMRRNSGVLNAA